MKMNRISKGSIALLAIPLAGVAVVSLHPGVAFAQTDLSRELKPSSFALPGTFNIDPMHTCAGFEIGHMGISRVQGRFNDVSGTIYADPQDLGKSSVEILIKTPSIDTAVAPRDADLRSDNYFDVARYPEIRFKSTSIRAKGSGYVAEGDLTIKGVTKKVSLPFHKFGPITDQATGGMRAGFVVDPIEIDRLDFKVGSDAKLPGGAYALSPEVTVRISVEAVLPKKS
jgi:polyisoprenoid-binding protein YceI